VQLLQGKEAWDGAIEDSYKAGDIYLKISDQMLTVHLVVMDGTDRREADKAIERGIKCTKASFFLCFISGYGSAFECTS